MNYLKYDKKHTWHPYDSLPSQNKILAVKKTYKQTIVLEDGRKLTDAMSSWWSAIFGYNHPFLIKALNKQADIMPHIMFGGLTHRQASLLCKNISKLTKLPSVFLADSGSVAVEVALKTAILYQKAKGKKTNKFIALNNAYHGDTLGCMGVCDRVNSMHSLYDDYLPNNIFTSVKNLEKTIKKHKDKIAGVVLEPIVQGAGGMKIHKPKYLKIARKLCTKYDLVLIIDEIATGFGHTGKMWGSNWANITADIMTIGKSLTGGLMSLGAVATTKKISDTISNSDIKVLMHGPTFMGNALSCAVANANIELFLKFPWEKKVKNIEKIFKKNLYPLKDYNIVKDVRVIGAIGVIELKSDKFSKILQDFCVQNGVWIRPFNNLFYSIISYTITNNELKKITKTMCKAVEYIEQLSYDGLRC
jgi:adenosylmethionine-8-amino-7-oxononanoate aminotransferase